MKRSILFYIGATVASAFVATVAVAYVGEQSSPQAWNVAAVFALIGFVAELLSYRRGSGATDGSVAFLPFLTGVLIVPSAPIVVSVFAVVLAANILLRKPVHKIVFNASQLALSTAVAALIVAPRGGLVVSELGLVAAMHYALGAFGFFVVNSLLVVGAISLAQNRMFWPAWKRIVGATLAYDVAAMPMIVVLAWLYAQSGVVWLLAVVLPLLLVRQLYKQNAQLEKITGDLLQLMVAAIEARDPYTSGHSRRVAAYSRLIARNAKLSARAVDRVVVAALLHDVGKIHEVYAPLLRKPGRLTDDEMAVIKTHPIKSAELVGKVGQLSDVVAVVRAHHERWDGAGYPDGLRGSGIPLGARIIALADTIDAMRTSRPYRDALSVESIREEVSKNRGSQFDPALVDVLLRNNAWTQLTTAMQRFERFAPSDELTGEEAPDPQETASTNAAS